MNYNNINAVVVDSYSYGHGSEIRRAISHHLFGEIRRRALRHGFSEDEIGRFEENGLKECNGSLEADNTYPIAVIGVAEQYLPGIELDKKLIDKALDEYITQGETNNGNFYGFLERVHSPGMFIGMVGENLGDIIVPMLREADYLGYFDDIVLNRMKYVGGEMRVIDEVTEKDQHIVMRDMLERHGREPENTLYIGDHEDCKRIAGESAPSDVDYGKLAGDVAPGLSGLWRRMMNDWFPPRAPELEELFDTA